MLALVPTALLAAINISGVFLNAPFKLSVICMALFVICAYFGCGVFVRGLSVFKRKKLNEEFFAMLAVAACFCFSAYEGFMIIFTDRGAERLMYLPGCAIICVTLLKECLEEKIRFSDGGVYYKLEKLSPEYAYVLRDGVQVKIEADNVREGDIVAVKPGEVIPCDGEVLAGRSDVGEEILNGIILPVFKEEGSAVKAGSTNLSGFLTVRAFGNDGEIGRLIKAYSRAKRPEARSVARKISVILGLLAVGAFIAASVIGMICGRGIFIAVVLAAGLCPCGFSVSKYAVCMHAVKKCASEGVELRDPSALENLCGISAAVIDRSGTASVGKYTVAGVAALSDVSENDTVRIAAALCAEFSGAGFEAVVNHCRMSDIAVPPCIAAERLPGKLTGLVDGKRAEISTLWEDIGPFSEDFPQLYSDGKTVMAVYSADSAIGLISVEDKLKPNAALAVKSLADAGIKTYLVTGSLGEGIESEALALGAKDFKAEFTAEDRLEYIKELKSGGNAVIAVGDDVCDAPALRGADFSFATGAGSEEAKLSAAAVLIRNDLRDILSVSEIACSAQKTEKTAVLATAAFRAVLLAASAAIWAVLGLHAAIIAESFALAVSCVPAPICAMFLKKSRK